MCNERFLTEARAKCAAAIADLVIRGADDSAVSSIDTTLIHLAAA